MSKPKAVINLDDKADKESELGTLIVILLKARNLNDKHSFRKSDVFAQATLNGVQKRTHVDIKGGQRPEWDGEVRFSIKKNTGAKFRKLEVSCYSQEPRSEDLMGQGVVDITETLKTGEFDDWVPLAVDGVQRGEIYLEMTYYANAPPPASAAPAPNKQLAALLAPSQGNLGRRPSKLSPSERLSRPQPVPSGQRQELTAAQAYAQSHSSQTPRVSSSAPSQPSRLQEQYSSQGNLERPGSNQKQSQNGVPASMRPAHSSSNGRHDSLPGNQEQAYGAYPGPRPGQQTLGTAPTHQQQQQQPQGAPLPNILRPGPGGSPPSTSPRPGHGHVRHPSAPLPSTEIYPGYGQDQPPPSTNPYIGGNVSPPNIYIGGRASPQPPSQLPNTNVYIQGQGNPNLSVNSGSEPARVYSPVPPTGPTTVPGPLPNSIQVQGVPFVGYGSPPRGTPLLWQQNTQVNAPPSNGSGFLFPAPNVSSPIQERQRHQSFSGYSETNALAYNNNGTFANQHAPPNVGYIQQQPYQQPPSLPGKSLSQDERPIDPYLLARYQTPLPLPPGASAPSASAPTRPAPSVPSQPPAASLPQTQTIANIPPRQVGTPGPDRARLEALKRAEEEASRRREQELKDLELALQLDRELNLAEERSNLTARGGAGGSGPMPGSWR